MEQNMNLYPGTRVKLFDPLLYHDDIKTPLSATVKKATVVKWYGKSVPPISGEDGSNWEYENLVDVRFDHRPDSISHGHFAYPPYMTIVGKEASNGC